MTIPLDLIESDDWPRIRHAIQVERARRIEGLLFVATLDGMRKQQGFIEALDWVTEEALPKPVPSTDEDED